MQTITTKHLPATNTKPRRIVATSSGGVRHVRSHSGGEYQQEHFKTARELKRSLGWPGSMVAGDTKDGFVFVFTSGRKIW